MRKIVNINNDWKFIKENVVKGADIALDDKAWQSVNIPHTWNAIDGSSGLDYYAGACWYRKEFNLDMSDKKCRVFIEFNASNSITDVYVNKKLLGQHRGGFSTFRFDITDAVEFGSSNLLAVKVDNTVVGDVYPLMADFTFYGGIYRDVNVVITNDMHIDLMDHGSKGIYIVQEAVSKENASLVIKTKIVNDGDQDKKIRLWIDILNKEGQVAAYGAKEVEILAHASLEVEIPVVIENPILWNGMTNPYMYNAVVSLQTHNDTIDIVTIPFGVRYFKVDSKKGFFLNGEHYPLRGVSRHQDRKDMGWAITKKQEKEDMELIKEVGATSIRLAHYQHNANFYDLCDQEGMVVWAEIPFISTMSETDLEGLNAKQQMVELIRQNFNHPSIMFWGIQNEIQIAGDSPETRKVVKALNELTKKEDPTRLSTMANVMMVDETDEYNYITDVLGFNKYDGWYVGKCEDFKPWIENYHKVNPDVKLCISEYGAEGIIEYHSNTPEVRDYTEEYHALYHEKVWKIFKDQPQLWGTYVWNMFDFGANIRDEGGVKGRNNKGLVTYDRKIKKDAFYMYKAHWSNEPFVYITSKRFVDRVDEKISIKVYSNCKKVTLYINGTEHSRKKGDEKILIFENVMLNEGLNRIKAVATFKGGTCEDVAVFNKVAESNKSYEVPEEGKKGMAGNWFTMPELEDVKIEELVITDDVLSTRCTLGEIASNPEGMAVLDKYLGKLVKHPMFKMGKGMTLDVISQMASDFFTKEFMYTLNRDLIKIKRK